MGIFDSINKGWIQWHTNSFLTIETLNGIALYDPLTRACPLCVAVNKCYFIDKSKQLPEQPLHEYCKCKKQPTNSLTPNSVKLDFPMNKITQYLFTHPSKKGFIESLGYTKDDVQEVYNEIANQSKINYAHGNYQLKKLKVFGGQNIIIPCTLAGKGIKTGRKYSFYTGWSIYPNGKIKHNTPLLN